MSPAMADASIPRLTTARLLLREWCDADREPFAELNADPRVAEFLSRPLDRVASDAFVDRIVAPWESDGCGLWAVERQGRRVRRAGRAVVRRAFHAN